MSAREAMAHPWFEDLHPQYNSFRNNNCYGGNQKSL